MQQQDKVKVLLITGNGRSGSTLLGVILGQLDGFFNVGEMRRIWDGHNSERDRELGHEGLCACGEPFGKCPAWGAIFKEAFGGMDVLDREKLSAWCRKFSMHKRIFAPTMRRTAFPWEAKEFEEFLSVLDKLYAAIPRATGTRVVVDASKWPMYGAMLAKLPSVELYILHLIRDPHAVVHSFTRRKEYKPGFVDIPLQGMLKTIGYWLAVNPAVEKFWGRTAERYMFLPYESFVRDPKTALSRIKELVGEPDVPLPIRDNGAIMTGPTHAISGNEVRGSRGEIRLRLDDEWRRKMPWAKRMVISAMTWPLLLRYGYTGQPPAIQDG